MTIPLDRGLPNGTYTVTWRIDVGRLAPGGRGVGVQRRRAVVERPHRRRPGRGRRRGLGHPRRCRGAHRVRVRGRLDGVRTVVVRGRDLRPRAARRRARRGHAAVRRGHPPGRRAGGDHRCHHDGGVVAVPHRPGRRRARRRPRQQRRGRLVAARPDRRVDRRHRGRPAARGDHRQPLTAVVPLLVVRCGRAGGTRWLRRRGPHPHPEPAVGDRDVRRRAPRRRRLLVGRRRGAGAGLPGARRRPATRPTGPPVQHVGARHRDRRSRPPAWGWRGSSCRGGRS